MPSSIQTISFFLPANTHGDRCCCTVRERFLGKGGNGEEKPSSGGKGLAGAKPSSYLLNVCAELGVLARRSGECGVLRFCASALRGDGTGTNKDQKYAVVLLSLQY